jgi:hypothetical protein
VRERLEQRLQELRVGFEKGEQALEDLEKQSSMEQHATTRGEVRP